MTAENELTAGDSAIGATSERFCAEELLRCLPEDRPRLNAEHLGAKG